MAVVNFGGSFQLDQDRGAGLGSIFKTLYKTVSPLVKKLFTKGTNVLTSNASKKLLKEARKAGLKAGLNVAESALSGENIGESALENLEQFGKSLVSRANRLVDKKKKIKTKPVKRKLPKPKAKPKVNSSLTGVKKIKYTNTTQKGRANDIFDDEDLEYDDFKSTF